MNRASLNSWRCFLAHRKLSAAILLCVGLFDYWAWSNLLVSGFGEIGALVGFAILAILSIPITCIGVIGALLLAEEV